MATKWDTWAFQDMLLRMIEGKERYRGEHEARIARKQSNGNARMRDSLRGEVKAFEALLGGSMYPTAASLIAKIDELQTQPAPAASVAFAESYESGWSLGLREARRVAGAYEG